MKRYKVTILMPHEREFEALNAQDAHNKVTKMMMNSVEPGEESQAMVHSIIELPCESLVPPLVED